MDFILISASELSEQKTTKKDAVLLSVLLQSASWLCVATCACFLQPRRLNAELQIPFMFLFFSPSSVFFATGIWSAQERQNVCVNARWIKKYVYLCVHGHITNMNGERVFVRVCALWGAWQKDTTPARKPTTLCLIFLSECVADVSRVCVCVRVQWEGEWVRKCRAQRVWVGTLFSTERSPLFSTACRPHHLSYQATLYGLNGLAGMAAPR